MDCNGAAAVNGGLRVEVFGQMVPCPLNQYIDLSTLSTGIPEDAPMVGRLGPCPPSSNLCPSLNCAAVNDCNGHGVCSLGKCSCFLGYGGADCSQTVCSLEAGKINSCPAWQVCNPVTFLCDAKPGTAQPPPPAPAPPPPPPGAPVTRGGVINPSPLQSCAVIGDVDGDFRAEFYDFLGTSNVVGNWTVRTLASSPVVSFDPTPVGDVKVDPNVYVCRDAVTGDPMPFRYRNAVGGSLLSPLSAMHALILAAEPQRDSEALRIALQQCLLIPSTENILTIPVGGMDPLRILAYNARTSGSNATKQHHYTNLALLNGMFLVGISAADSIRLSQGRLALTADDRISGGDAILAGVAYRCLNASTFDAANSTHWREALAFGVSKWLGTADVFAGTGTTTILNAAIVASVAADVNFLLNRRFFNAGLVGVDVVADAGKFQFIISHYFSPYTEQFAAGNLSPDAYNSVTNTSGSNVGFGFFFAQNSTYNATAVLLMLNQNPADILPPVAPASGGNKGSSTKRTSGGIIAAYVFVFIFAIIIIIGLGAWYLQYSSTSGSERLRLCSTILSLYIHTCRIRAVFADSYSTCDNATFFILRALAIKRYEH